jgi:hypothetical protein
MGPLLRLQAVQQWEMGKGWPVVKAGEAGRQPALGWRGVRPPAPLWRAMLGNLQAVNTWMWAVNASESSRPWTVQCLT